MNESNALHNDLELLGAPLVDRVSLRKPRHNVNEWRRAVHRIHKENNLMLLRWSRYHMLQLVEDLATTTTRQLTPCERNSVLSYEPYQSE